EHGRAAPADPLRGGALHGMAQAPARGPSRDHRALAGEREERSVLRPDGQAGHPLHRDLVPGRGRPDPSQDGARSPSWQGILRGRTVQDEVRVGVLGCGHWGPNHIRVFSSLRRSGARMVVAADTDASRREHVGGLYLWVRVEREAEAVLDDPDVDAVIVATPVHTHYPFAMQALLKGKHVLIEKPFVTEVEQARELIAMARQAGRVLMVGHTFEYAAAVNQIRAMLAE